ncbi:hypothetical protein [Senegalia massiliensis]|uniref:Uncharacterized protein n=1 Tax=Senegalia massiliensis TaxID=1720316 RepID=A0A845QXA8_9CLOT|nr:hypothetical protein [Senegalia massiliensis]NBI06624.1 hypothetical protein [Senegalia massiliensis]
MGRSDNRTFMQILTDMTNYKKARYIVWYCTPEDEREDFEDLNKKVLGDLQRENVEKWRLEPDVSKGIQYYMKLLHTEKMKNIYDKMYQQALDGDVQSAKYLMDFSKDFFKDIEGKNELESILDNINLGIEE